VRWSRVTWIVTVGVSIIVALIPVLILRTAVHAPPGNSVLRVVLIVAGFVPVVILGIVALFAPLAVEVSSEAVVVKRLVRDVVIPLADVREIRRLESGQAGFMWRLCGCGGFLGWFGLFYSRGLGEFWAYAGNRADLVLLTRIDGTKIVVSADPPDAFVEVVQKSLQLRT
jgi:hypothetical protein